MPINKFGTEYILEFQDGQESEGILCRERVLVRVRDGGAFLSIKTDNLEPTEEYDNHTVTVSREDIVGFTTALLDILAEYGE